MPYPPTESWIASRLNGEFCNTIRPQADLPQM
jgi:hypothetical protein